MTSGDVDEDAVARTNRRRRRRWPLVILAGCLAAVLASAGVFWANTHPIAAAPQRPYTGPLPTTPIQTPVATAYSWFTSMNRRDVPLQVALEEKRLRTGAMASAISVTFRDLHCSQQHRATKGHARVTCTFARITAPTEGMSATTFWSVTLVRNRSGHWLVATYGQP